jgi:tetratricopeptide (TPR) repeat protein/tRNA A-37 threonylcarbamoyl transferase component Bud32
MYSSRSSAEMLMTMIEIKEHETNLAGLKIKNRYVLLEEIGSGLMARAYLAYDELLEGEVVVKVINTEIGGINIPLGPEWVQEAKRAMKVRGCPFIATVTDFGEETCNIEGEDKIIPFIVWERVYGKTLQQFMEEGHEIDEGMVISTIIQLLQVLIALKRNNLVHGDLHIKNVMYDDVSTMRHYVKVIDFGLSNLISTEADFKRDRKGVGKVLWDIIDTYEKNIDATEKTPFMKEVEKLADDVAAPHAPTLDELNEILGRAEELERKLFLGVEWFQTRHKKIPIGLKPVEYVKSLKNPRNVPLVGTEEITELERWVRNGLDEGLGRILVIKGNLGSGKSRWSLELLDNLAHSNEHLSIMQATAYPGDSRRPLEPIRRLWKSFLGEKETGSYKSFLENLFPELPFLVEPLSELLTPKAGEIGEIQNVLDVANTSKLITTGFKHLALKNGLVICIDNANCADSQSLSLLAELLETTRRYPLVLILSYDIATEGTFAELTKELARRDNFLQYEVRELAVHQVQELILKSYRWHLKEDAHKLTEILFPLVGGNPFFITEMMKSLESRNFIVRESGFARLDNDVKVEFEPTSIQSLMLARIENLPEEIAKIVKLGAVLGSEFHLDHLAALYGSSLAAMEMVANRLADEHQILIRSDDMYAFNPRMLYNAVYSSIPEENLKQYNLQAAEMLKARVHLDPKLNAQVAEHLLRAGITENVAEYFLRAARYSFKVNLIEQANSWCDNAIQILQNTSSKDENLLGRLHLLKGALEKHAGHAESYRENIFKGYNFAILSRDKKLEGNSLKALGEYYRSIADYMTSVEYFQNALDILRQIRDEQEEALLLKELSINYCFMGNFERAIEMLGMSREICEKLDDREGMARIYNNMGLIYKIQGDIPLSKEWLERSITLFREIDDIQGEVLPIGNMAIIYTEEGEFERAMILLKEITSSDNRLTDTRIKAKVNVTMGDVLLELGEYKETMEHYEKALMVFRALGDRQGECETLTNMAMACLEQNKLNLASNYSRLAKEIKEQIGYERGIPFNHLINARIARILGDYEKAKDSIKEGLKHKALKSAGGLKFEFLLEFAIVYIRDNDNDSAMEKFNLIETAIRENSEKTSRTFLVKFMKHYGDFLNIYQVPGAGDVYIRKSIEILDSLERKIFQHQWKQKFRSKYNQLLQPVRPSTPDKA